jgi:uncharacterized metal-binding protein
MNVIENVAGTREEILQALAQGRIRPGFGLEPEPESAMEAQRDGSALEVAKGRWPEIPRSARDYRRTVDTRRETDGLKAPSAAGPNDCLECTNRVCLQGESCPFLDLPDSLAPDLETQRILESTWDVALEEERTLCRLAELVYFGLEMGYQRLGVGFCEDLREPATILTRVLRRFFEVIPVGCKAHGEFSKGIPEAEGTGSRQLPGSGVPCDPQAVAEILNSRNTDLNVLVGFCTGADCIFNKSSRAPVTTIFVKDKSLANNPIGAVYSHYYLTEI